MNIILKKFDFDQGAAYRKRKLGKGQEVQRFIDSECMRLMNPYTPFRQGMLIGAASNGTNIGSGKIIQQTPYAKRWYYEPANFSGAPMRGNKWFERMKQSHKQSILKGAAAIAGARS